MSSSPEMQSATDTNEEVLKVLNEKFIAGEMDV